MASGDDLVCWVFRSDIRDHISPSEHGKRNFRDSSVDWSAILDVPDYEGVILANACKELVIWRKYKPINALLYAF